MKLRMPLGPNGRPSQFDADLVATLTGSKPRNVIRASGHVTFELDIHNQHHQDEVDEALAELLPFGGEVLQRPVWRH